MTENNIAPTKPIYFVFAVGSSSVVYRSDLYLGILLHQPTPRVCFLGMPSRTPP
jgi:hypothetical protein